jgi:hypothetical protein
MKMIKIYNIREEYTMLPLLFNSEKNLEDEWLLAYFNV